MEEDFFQGALQDYLEGGEVYNRCWFQWSLVQCLVHEKHMLIEMSFASDCPTEDYMNAEYSHQTSKILERAVNAVIKGSLIRSICFTQSTTIEEVQVVME